MDILIGGESYYKKKAWGEDGRGCWAVVEATSDNCWGWGLRCIYMNRTSSPFIYLYLYLYMN